MTHEKQIQIVEECTDPEPPGRADPAAYLWRPWHARVWWAAMPVYWIGMAVSARVPTLADFYDLALAGYLNVLFFPPSALMVLGVGYVREWMGPIDWSGASDPGNLDIVELDQGPSGLPYYADPLDPRSGALWIGYSEPPA